MDAGQQDAWDWDWEVLLPDHRSSSSVRHHHGSNNNTLDGKDRPSIPSRLTWFRLWQR
jgi:hypothetical protein